MAEPTAAAVAADHYKRGVELWGQNRQAAIAEFRVAAQSNPDAYYYLGLNLVEGHDHGFEIDARVILVAPAEHVARRRFLRL